MMGRLAMTSFRGAVWALPIPLLCVAACTMDFGSFAFRDEPVGGGTTTGTTTGTPTGTGGTESGGGGSVAVGGGGSTATGGAGGTSTCDFTATNSCGDSEELDEVRGDQGDDQSTATGIGSRWFRVHVAEVAGINNPLSYGVTLTSPAATRYELYVYPSALNAAAPDCGAPAVAGTGTPPSVTDQWNDDTFGFDNDDRWLAAEVRYASGNGCEPGDEWLLEVRGND